MSCQSLWPAEHLCITADTSESVDALLHPREQMRFLKRLTSAVDAAHFADSLVYSTPQGNTGWTAFRFGRQNHFTYHHWDNGNPDLLQLDLYRSDGGPLEAAIECVKDFWLPIGLRAVAMRSQHPLQDRDDAEIIVDTLARRTRPQKGLGPGNHLYVVIDRYCNLSKEFNPTKNSLDIHLNRLVSLLGMRPMTAVMSRVSRELGGDLYCGIVGITTSHCCMRVLCNERRAELSLEVLSCRDFEPKVIMEWLESLGLPSRNQRAIVYNRFPLMEFDVVSQ